MYCRLIFTILLILALPATGFSQVPQADTIKRLAEVKITARKPLVQTRGDKIIYNAGADISNRSGTAADVLRKAPLLTVDPVGNIKMRGSASIKVLLNGLPSGMMARSLKDALRMIPASSIVSVEIITNPSTKYDAEGAAGVINIITKKKVSGTSGHLDLSGGNLERSLDGGLSISRDRFNVDMSAGVSRERQRNTWDLDRTSITAGQASGQLLQKADASELWKGIYGDLSAEYRPDSIQTLGLSFSYWDGSFPSKSSFYSRLAEKGQPVNEYKQQSDQQMKFGSYDLSVNYHRKFKRTAQKLELLSQYSRNVDNSLYTTLQYAMTGAGKFTESGRNHSSSNDLSFQADYTHPLSVSGKHLLEIGAKYSDEKASSTYKVFNSGTGADSSGLKEDPGRSDAMRYFQRTVAAYISLQLKLKNNWMLRPGLRYENAEMGGRFEKGKPAFTASFNNFTPSILVLKTFNDQHSVKFNFSQRIRKPAIWDLNPYVNASDPQNLSSGNPHLRPEITRTLELGYELTLPSGFTLNSAVYFSKNDNAIEALSTIDNRGISMTTAQNIAQIQRFGSNFNVSLQANDKLTINAGVELYKARFKSNALQVNNAGFYYTANLNVVYLLSPTFTIDLYGDYNKGEITLQGYNSSYYSYKFSMRKEFLHQKAGLTLSINNPFHHYLLQRNVINAPNFSSIQANRFYNRSIVLSFNWKFGGARSESRDVEKVKHIEDGRSIPHGKKKW